MKRIILTGASDGLGYEVAKILVQKKVEVVALCRTKPKDLNLIHIPVDLTDQTQIASAIETIKKSYPEFDALINDAGKFASEEADKLTFKATNETFQLNTIAPMLLTSGLFDLIKQNEADVLNVTSTISYKAYEKQAAYGASKWALRGYTENLRLELKDTRCRVINFAAGGFKSKIVEKFTGQEPDLKAYMEAKTLADFLVQILETPKEMEVSEVILNRKKK